MEAFLASPSGNILLGVIGNVLTEILFYMGDKGYEGLKGREPLKPHLDTTLTPILQKAVAAVARSAQFQNEHQARKLQMFLSAPEVEAIVRQIYASKLVLEQHDHLESIRAEFSALLSLQLGEAQHSPENLAFVEELFNLILQGCEQALQIAINRGVLAAHEAKSVARFHLLRDELAAIHKNLDFLTTQQQPNIQAILEFEKKYRQQVAARHEKIAPPNFDTVRKVPIDSLYVCPNFITTPKSRNEQPETLQINQFLSIIYRAVLLGNPGGGKSTFTLKLCHDLAAHYSKRLFAGRQVTPILVVLRDYGAEKKQRNCSILQFIETTANSDYQIQPPPGAFEYLLLNGRAVVIFDGLDELLETSYRQEISSDVESFCTLYPSVPTVVTSREVGYEQAPLDEEKFEIFRLSPFDEEQVKDYVGKWFSLDTHLTDEQQKQKVEAFLDESEVVPDLRSNPLILALLCNIYRGDGYIPRNRPDVYEKCALMLFERWDKGRGIRVPLPFEVHIKPTMMCLAHWIYTNEVLKSGVTEQSLVTKAADYLCPKVFDDRDEAEKAACEFIEFCRGRAWVFTDTGTTKEGERLYQFTHRTFLEYFTAIHLVRISRTPDDLRDILLPRIAKREWDVVAQLAFQIQDKKTEGAGDELLTSLLNQFRKAENEEKRNLLSFATRCLEFMVPTPKVRRDITTAVVEFYLDFGLEQVKQWQDSKNIVVENKADIFVNLVYSGTENLKAIANRVEVLFIEKINDSNESRSYLALELALVGLNNLINSNIHSVNIVFWQEVFERIIKACSTRIEELLEKHLSLCLAAFHQGMVSVGNFVKWHRLTGIFQLSFYCLFPFGKLSVAEVILPHVITMISYVGKQSEQSIIADLNELGYAALSSELPLVSKPHLIGFDFIHFNHLPINKSQNSLKFNSDALFGAFVLIAITLETKRQYTLIRAIKERTFPLFQLMRSVFLARFDSVDADRVQAEIDCCKFTPDQQTFIWQWVRQEINLVEASEQDETLLTNSPVEIDISPLTELITEFGC